MSIQSPSRSDEFWQKQEASYQAVREQTFSSDQLHQAIERRDHAIFACMDEGVVLDGRSTFKVGNGGLGANWSDDQRQIVADRIKDEMAHGWVTQVSFAWHGDGECGACKSYCVMHPDCRRSCDKVAYDAAVWWQKALDLPGEPQKISAEPGSTYRLHRPAGSHIARLITVIGTPYFNSQPLNLAPDLRLNARFYPDWETLNAELQLAQDIAMGSHGFGHDRFGQPGHELLIWLIGDGNEYSSARLESKLKALNAYPDATKIHLTDL